MRARDRLAGPLLFIAIFALLAALALGCGGPATTSIAGTWRSWVAVSADLEAPTSAGCSGLTTEGTVSFETPKGDEVSGRWDLCAGSVNFAFHGVLLPDGWTIEVPTATGLLTLLPRSATPSRMVFELRGLGFSGEHLLVLERGNIRHGKLEIEQ